MPYTDRANGFNDPVNNAPLQGTIATVASAGTNQATAAAITAAVTKVTGADATKGVILPDTDAARIGVPIVIINDAAAVLPVYPPTGGSINGGAANASASLAANTVAILWLMDGSDNWYGLEAAKA